MARVALQGTVSYHPFQITVISLPGKMGHFLSKLEEKETRAIAFRRFFSKFDHSSEFRVFSLENIENLVLNLRPGNVY